MRNTAARGAALVLGCLLGAAAAGAIEIVVEPGGALSLQDGVRQARSGDTLLVHEGVYVLPTSLRLQGKSDIVIRGIGEVWLISEDYYSEVLSLEDCSSIEIQGLRATHREWSAEYACNAAVIGLSRCSGIAIEGCEMNGCGSMGVAMERSREILISGCYIHHNNYCALYIYDSDDITVRQNTIVDNASLLAGYDIGSLEMEGNTIAGNGPR